MGGLAVVFAVNGSFRISVYLISISMIADFFDGFLARRLKTHPIIGKELDALADVVSFGLYPSVLMLQWLMLSQGTSLSSMIALQPLAILSGIPALLILGSAALRLARFNAEPSSTEHFRGLSTPANTLLIIGLFSLSAESDSPLRAYILSYVLGFLISVGSAYLQLSDVKLLTLKFENFSWKGNEWRYALIISSVLLLPFLGIRALAGIIVLYLLFSILHRNFKSKIKE